MNIPINCFKKLEYIFKNKTILFNTMLVKYQKKTK